MRNLWADERGVVAVIFAVIAIPFLALAGWGVDYLRLYHVKDYMQVQTDTAALFGATDESKSGDWKPLVEGAMTREYGTEGWARNVDVSGDWLTPDTEFEVRATATVPLTFMRLVPGIPEFQDVSVLSVARRAEPTYEWEAPEFAQLDYEAGDYNRIWLYCFNPDNADDPETQGRTQMVPIADNSDVLSYVNADEVLEDYDIPAYLAEEIKREAVERYQGLPYETAGLFADGRAIQGIPQNTVYYQMPQCIGDSYLSYRLENVRFERGNSRDFNPLWDSGGMRFNYFTDSKYEAGAEVHTGLHDEDGEPYEVLETVVCDRREQCRTGSGGIVPDGKGRDPEKATERCVSTASDTNYMYYGWEDRPPDQPGAANDWRDPAWTDTDYDDIVIVQKCPERKETGELTARLVR